MVSLHVIAPAAGFAQVIAGIAAQAVLHVQAVQDVLDVLVPALVVVIVALVAVMVVVPALRHVLDARTVVSEAVMDVATPADFQQVAVEHISLLTTNQLRRLLTNIKELK